MRSFTIVGGLALALVLAPGDGFAKKPDHAGKPGKSAQSSAPGSSGGGHGPPAKKAGPASKKVLRELTHQGGGPPPWAPAHGYRRKHGGGGSHGRYEVPYGFDTGICKRDAIAAVLGGVGGGIMGGVLSDGDTTAIVGGILGGALLGTILSKTGDPVDRGCFGQALEHGPSHKTISWRNPDQGVDYRFVPKRTFETEGGRYCREYTTTIITAGGRERTENGTACREPDGSWR